MFSVILVAFQHDNTQRRYE